MAVRSKNDLIANGTDGIEDSLANNNAGLITASDVRERMVDIVESVELIVSSGQFNTTYPFQGNIRIAASSPASTTSGSLIVESGVQFPNNSENGVTKQTVAYPGNAGVSHNSLADLTTGDVHTQYTPINGSRELTGNFGTDAFWINSSGNNDISNSSSTANNRGLQFTHSGTSPNDVEVVHVGSKSTVEFDGDNSTMDTAKGVARAWINFDGNAMTVRSSHNISELEKISQGKFKISFTEAFPDTNYVAIGFSNAVAGDGTSTADDFQICTVGIVERAAGFLKFHVKSDDHDYVNAHMNDLIVFGRNSSDDTAESTPTITTPAPT
tara:strand:+ start:3180 stop:4157 length:978 start_codon:yes stop_codon:yes gene_type:complete